jgi:hypothetical protein
VEELESHSVATVAGTQELVITGEEAERLRAQYVRTMNGKVIPDNPGALPEDRQIERIHGELRSSLIIDPGSGAIPGNAPFKEQAVIARAATLNSFDGPEQRPFGERCLFSNGAPPMQPIPENNYYQIVQTTREIVISSELVHDARSIRLNASHTPAAVTSWLGDSVGWREGDTLVVETKYFAPNNFLRVNARNPFFVSPQTTGVERFTRVANDEINYLFTVSDPTYYTRASTGETHLLHTIDQMYEFSCHKGNCALQHLLEAARIREKNADK